MRVPFDVSMIVNMGGTKGGVGISTVTANLAYVLGGPGAQLEPIGLVDVAYGTNSTVSKLFGLDPKQPGFWDFLMGRVTGREASIYVHQIYNLRMISNGSLSPDQLSWMIGELHSAARGDPDRVGSFVLSNAQELIVSKLKPYGASVVLVDLPSPVDSAVKWAFLRLASVVNVFVKAGNTHVDEAAEVLDLISIVNAQRARDGQPQLAVYAVVNQSFPNDNTVSFLKGKGPVSKFIVLPYSPFVSDRTDRGKDIAIKYDAGKGDAFFQDWRSKIINLAKEEYQVARGAAPKKRFW